MGDKPRNFVSTTWSPQLGYAVGLLTTDGCLYNDGRHINLTSKELEQIQTFKACLHLRNKVGRKSRGQEQEKRYYQVQFGSVQFYQFLIAIGLTPAKSRTLASLKIPDKYFPDFLRGCIDGDGNISNYFHPESRQAQLRLRLTTASKLFAIWMQRRISELAPVQGGWISKGTRSWILAYGKYDTVVLLKFMYYPNVKYFLSRKYELAKPFLRM